MIIIQLDEKTQNIFLELSELYRISRFFSDLNQEKKENLLKTRYDKNLIEKKYHFK